MIGGGDELPCFGFPVAVIQAHCLLKAISCLTLHRDTVHRTEPHARIAWPGLWIRRHRRRLRRRSRGEVAVSKSRRRRQAVLLRRLQRTTGRGCVKTASRHGPFCRGGPVVTRPRLSTALPCQGCAWPAFGETKLPTRVDC
ncbi:hypothetical protein MTO96_021510 [Rhipicephalus appendiculatus]